MERTLSWINRKRRKLFPLISGQHGVFTLL